MANDDMVSDDEGEEEEGQGSRLRAFFQLVRLPNLFTAMADVGMGLLVVRADDLPLGGRLIAVLVVASTLLYAAGVVLNDLFDYKIDCRERPERPLPSGRISLRFAKWLGWESLFIGAALTWLAAYMVGQPWPGVVGTVLAANIVFYNAWAKRTPLGPAAMGLCRALNVLLGMSVIIGVVMHPAAESFADAHVLTVTIGTLLPAHWLIALAVGVYIAGVTWFARTEVEVSGRVPLVLATATMVAGIAILAWLPHWAEGAKLDEGLKDPNLWLMLIGLMGAMGTWRCVLAILNPEPEHVQTAVAMAIVSLVMFDGAACFAFRGAMYATVIVALILPAMMLSQWFRST